jgi:iron complex outermembrane receptor protein
VLCLAAGPVFAIDAPVLGAEGPLIVDLVTHARPLPYPVPLPFAGGSAPVFNPYVQNHIALDGGAPASVLEAQRTLKLGGGYAGAGDAWEAFAQGGLAFTDGALNAALAQRSIDDYRDGDGSDVRFGYERTTGQLGGAWFPDAQRSLRAGVVYDRIDDLRMPLGVPVVENGIPLIEGAGADPLKTERTGVRLAFDDARGFGALRRVRLAGGWLELERKADNFTLRTTPAANRIRNALSASIWDATAFGDFAAGGAEIRVGAEFRSDSRDGQRRGGPAVNNLDQITGFQAPGPEATTYGAFVEAAGRPWGGGSLAGALRWQGRDADITGADAAFALPGFAGTPRSLYALYYGAGLDLTPHHDAVSALVEARHQFAAGGPEARVSAGRIARFPDLFEFSVALPSSPATNVANGTPSRQVGNPGLDTEIHHRIEAGMTWAGADWAEWRRVRGTSGDRFAANSWRLALSASYDRIDDFVSRDRARAQAGVLRADNAAIWRNVDAEIAAAEADLQWNLTRNLSMRANVWWNYGQNTTDDRPLYGISPLETTLIADWHDRLATVGTWNAAARLRMVANQDRADDDPATGSGYDPAETAGFTVLDLFAGVQFSDRVGVQVGIDNVFDRNYAEHVPYRTTDDTNLGLVYAPGRFAWLRIVVNF